MIKLRFNTSDERWINIASRFWQYDPEIKKFPFSEEQLANEMHVSVPILRSKLVDLCQAFDDEFHCGRCGGPLQIFRTRRDYLSFYGGLRRLRKKDPTALRCNSCQRIGLENYREVAKRPAMVQRQQAEDARKHEILNIFKDERPRVALADLTLEQAVFLNAYGRAGFAEDYQMLYSVNTLRSWKRKLAPLVEHDLEIVSTLFDAQLIEIHPNNSPNILLSTDIDEGLEFIPELTNCYFPVSVLDPDTPSSFFTEIEQAFLHHQRPENWETQVLPLWERVAVWECLEFLQYVLQQHGLQFTPGEKTIGVFQSLFTHFSTGQIHNFIWRAGRDAAAYYMRGNVSKRHAASTVVGSIQRFGEYAVSKEWSVKTFQRNFDCPQSIVSQVLFNAVLKIGEDGFTTLSSWNID